MGRNPGPTGMVHFSFHQRSEDFRWITEKMDGMRAYWNGHTLLSKYGNKITHPTWFISEFPRDTLLDGELWLGRGKYELLIGILSSSIENAAWKRISYVVFDSPSFQGPYERRIEQLKYLNFHEPITLIGLQQCQGNSHIRQQLEAILGVGGEGLMAHHPKSRYVEGRTTNLLKIKVWQILFLHFKVM